MCEVAGQVSEIRFSVAAETEEENSDLQRTPEKEETSASYSCPFVS
jgi:hypothetical protein